MGVLIGLMAAGLLLVLLTLFLEAGLRAMLWLALGALKLVMLIGAAMIWLGWFVSAPSEAARAWSQARA